MSAYVGLTPCRGKLAGRERMIRNQVFKCVIGNGVFMRRAGTNN